MKTATLIILLTFLITKLNGQTATWSGSTPGDIYYNSGNVGIGKIPSFKLDVAGQIATGYTYLDNSIDADNNYTRSNFGSNVYWDHAANRWQINPNGNNDFASIIHPNADGLAFITGATTGNIPRSLTHGEFMGHERMRINASGNVGIGAGSTSYRLHIMGGNPNSNQMTLGSANTGSFALTSADGGAYGLFAGVSGTGRAWLQVGRYDTNTSYDLVLQASGGNLLVGKASQTNPAYRLDVNGAMRTDEVVVNTTGADFVFQDEYQLRTLDEVEKYIAKHRHLPDMAPAEEMQKNGLALGEMNTKLLQKIEELTLYLIQLKNEVEELKKENAELKK